MSDRAEAQDRSLVKNAADAEQTKKGRTQKAIEENQKRNALLAVLATSEGRRELWTILEHCNIHASVYNRDALAMANLAARQDVGHWLMQRILRVDPEIFYLMMRENVRPPT